MAGKANQAVIESLGLTKIFRDFWGHQKVVAVDGLDLEIRSNEVYGLLGPNGSGKSTTIKMLLGLLNITRGWAKVLGQVPGNVKTNMRIGYLPEESYLYPFLNAKETLDFYGRLFGLPRSERRRRIDSLLEMVGLSGVSRRLIGEYSKGMTRRIGLAQALINDPDVLILDEPTSGLDPIGTKQIKDLIRELGLRGKTVLLCSHLLADVEDVCDRICILYGGKKQAEGTVETMLAKSGATEICCPKLDADRLASIRQVIQQQYPQGDVQVKEPRDRLEDVFLRIVQDAHAAEVETSGAIMGGGMGDFLGQPRTEKLSQEDVIGDLVSSARPPEKDRPIETVTVSAKEHEKSTREDVIDSLVTSPSDAEDGQGISEPQDSVSKEERIRDVSEVDRGVIEGLLEPEGRRPAESKERETDRRNEEKPN